MKKIGDYALIIIGNVLTAMAFGFIILPQSFACGGVTGLCVLLNQLIPIPLTVLLYIVNGLLFALGFFLVSKEFVMKTLISTLTFPLFLQFAREYHGFLSLAKDPFLSTVIAGSVLGLGSGLILRGDGSSGGFDILGVIAHKYFHIPVSTLMYVGDTIVILSQHHSILNTAYGIVIIVMCTIIINEVLSYGEFNSQIIIISSHYQEIREELLKHQDTGMTYLDAQTGYLGKQTKVIITVTPYSKIKSIKKAVNTIDPQAFVIIEDVRSVLGKGYTLSKN